MTQSNCKHNRLMAKSSRACASAPTFEESSYGLYTMHMMSLYQPGGQNFDCPQSNIIGVGSGNIFISNNASQIITIDEAYYWD